MTVETPMLRRLVEGEMNSLHLGVAAGSENHLRKIHVQSTISPLITMVGKTGRARYEHTK